MVTEEFTRRAVLRAGLIGSVGLVAAMAGCGTGAGPQGSSWRTSSSRGARDVSPNPPAKILLVYFSRAGENYWNGGRRNLKTGNTEVLAQMISKRVRCDAYRIEPADPYPTSYEDTVARNVEEEQADARPGIANPPPEINRYDTVMVGSPVWNVRAPMIMHTFIGGVDLTGKTVLPFVTYAVSGMGSVEQEYRDLLPGAKVRTGLAVRGETVSDSGLALEAWLRAAQLIP